ncbi:EscU/YscU/HrcU family type III secretion system export apparatus switch protein [Paremcibacter congregatus]|uniref:EscU/YscU/HrcU family type III secretion system export apparatus switch protein n=1 Tax=Paremcibacter congregatus TaxID=2043170 RepID=UPI0030ED5BC9|tara:strand:+ start:6687 stop:7013 length:327 start_codon:yes stop_codon:yes gene_type:complete
MATGTIHDNKRQKAVALTQGGDRSDIPRISASGTGKNAEKILQIAFDNDVKVRTDEDLVEILSAFDVDSYIPLDALQPVSEILSYLYNENIRLSEEKHHTLPSGKEEQ